MKRILIMLGFHGKSHNLKEQMVLEFLNANKI